MEFDLRPRKLDVYIVKKFITTFFVALLLIIGIVIIFDISEKIDDFVSKEAPLGAIIFDYYLNFVPYFMNMFSPLFVFITVIFFTGWDMFLGPGLEQGRVNSQRQHPTACLLGWSKEPIQSLGSKRLS